MNGMISQNCHYAEAKLGKHSYKRAILTRKGYNVNQDAAKASMKRKKETVKRVNTFLAALYNIARRYDTGKLKIVSKRQIGMGEEIKV